MNNKVLHVFLNQPAYTNIILKADNVDWLLHGAL